jgi:hypothetical protein
MQAKEHEGDEIEESGPKHSILRPQHTSRNNRRDGVRGVVQAVQEIEGQRDRDEADKHEGNVMQQSAPD